MSAHTPRMLAAPLMAALVALLLAGASGHAEPRLTKVPGKRFARGLYTAPDAEFTLRGDEWLLPGARAEEEQVASSSRGATFTDDFGGVYSVMRTSGVSESITLEAIGEGFKINDSLREKEIVTTDHGRELRLLGVARGASPMVRREREGKDWIERKLDLYQAMSVFIDHGALYRVTAGVSPLGEESEAMMFERAKRKLEAMLAGLTIRPPGP